MTKVQIDQDILDSDFVKEEADQSLRICCYGSSSAATPEKYLVEARNLGYILAKRGHVCVNGAGSFGCMAAMNDGCVYGNGHIVGVIHEMWLVDKGDWAGDIRDGGAHGAFSDQKNGQKGPIREMLVAGGDDLQERKKLLVDGANGLVVLPGGPGTWDELWEMACARGIGLTHLPIVCVNVDGYYEPFKQMLDRAYEDKLIKLKPHELVHFEPTAKKAIEWLEKVIREGRDKTDITIQKRSQKLREGTSFYHTPVTPNSLTELLRSVSKLLSEPSSLSEQTKMTASAATIFAVGTALGFALASRK